ncbi:MAG: c-type cytochrome biogenesis protein CcmF, partial [Acetobacteraceae bacterium]|nr:c-type cytochrome biogenesis protein CcmF [Acetobacteraceae bacterium]
LCIPLFAAMCLGPVLPWKRADLRIALFKRWWAALAAAIVGVIAALGVKRGVAALAFAGSAWLITGAFAEVIERARLFRVPFAVSRARLAAQPLAVWGAAIAHAGMGVTVAGVAGMSLAVSTIAAVQQGQTVALGGYDWTLLGIHDATGPNYTARVADLRVTRNGHEIAMFHPSRRMFTVQKTAVTDTAIETNGLRDLYAVLGEERDGQAILRLHVNPLAPWIWFGALIMAVGGMLSLVDRRLRVGAPSRRAVPVTA